VGLEGDVDDVLVRLEGDNGVDGGFGGGSKKDASERALRVSEGSVVVFVAV